jgi:hypothetical protein
MKGMRHKAATGSAHFIPKAALTDSPARAIQAMQPQTADSAASALNAALEAVTDNFRF